MKKLRPISIVAILLILIVWTGQAPCAQNPSPLPSDAFKAKIVVTHPPKNIKNSSIFEVKTVVKNISQSTWSAPQKNGINLAYHWLDKNGKMVTFDGFRTSLPQELKPNAEVPLKAKVKAPNKPGKYILEFDMVQELVGWFNKRGSQTTQIKITIS